jgi:hypothetical protein
MEIIEHDMKTVRLTTKEITKIVLSNDNELYYLDWKHVSVGTRRRFLRVIERLMKHPHTQDVMTDLSQKRVYVQMKHCNRFQAYKKHGNLKPNRTRNANFGIRTEVFDDKKWEKLCEEKRKNRKGIEIITE